MGLELVYSRGLVVPEVGTIQDGPFEFRVCAIYIVQEKRLTGIWVVCEGKPYLN